MTCAWAWTAPRLAGLVAHGRRIALVGTVAGRTDLYLLDLAPDGGSELVAASARAPTAAGPDPLAKDDDDAGDELGPRLVAWMGGASPSPTTPWRRCATSSPSRRTGGARWTGPASTTATRPEPLPHPQASRLVLLDVADGRRVELAAPVGSWREPACTAYGELCVVADGDGAENLACLTLDAAGRAPPTAAG